MTRSVLPLLVLPFLLLDACVSATPSAQTETPIPPLAGLTSSPPGPITHLFPAPRTSPIVQATPQPSLTATPTPTPPLYSTLIPTSSSGIYIVAATP
jgi:hypothetical protein